MTAMGLLGASLLLVGLAALLIIWLGYPLLIAARAHWRPWRWRRLPLQAPDEAWPRLSIIIAAHNEAAQIQTRIRNLIEQDYPAAKLEIIVSEDGSRDDTAARARAAAEGAPVPVRVLSEPQRGGKAAALNRAAAVAGGEVLVFTDANNLFAPQALRHLAAPFADSRVGAVTGPKTVAENCGVGGGEGVYWRYEGWLVRQESASGGAAAAFGEGLALRRELFRPVPTDHLTNDDLFLAMAVLAQKRRLVAAPAARSWELGAADSGSEWERRRRMAGGHWEALAAARREVGHMRAADAFRVCFHEVLRQASAVWLLLALAGAVLLWLAPQAAVGMRALAGLVLAGWSWVLAVGVLRRLGVRPGRGEAPYFFCLALAAAAVGAWRNWRHSESKYWRKAGRAEAATPAAGHRSLPAQGGILNGLFWASSSFLLGKVFSFGSVLILARLLVPKAFGEVAIAISIVGVLEVLGTLGLTSALVFEEREVDAAANLCFWITICTSLLTMAAAWLLAPVLAVFFHEPVLRLMLRALAIYLPITALGSTHDFLLRRRLSFRTKLLPDLGQSSVKGVAAIAMALLGFGAWSLIWGQLLGAVAATAILWVVVRWRPHRGLDRAVFGRMVHFAKHIYFLDGSSLLLLNLDTFTIGRMLTDTLLGFYTLAFRLPEVLLVSVLNVVARVTFPGFSRLQNDLPRMRRTLLDTARYTALFTLPMATGLGMLAPAVVFALYGKHWGPSVAVVEVLALWGGIRCVMHPFGDGYKAIGRPDVLTRTTVLWWAVLPPSLILGAHWGGIVGVAWGHVVTRSAMSLLHVYLVAKYLKISPATLLRCFAPALESSAIMAAAVWVARPLASGWGPRLELAAMVPFGAAVYGASVLLLHPQIARAALARVRRPTGPATAAPATELTA